jgi:hypothetical protein
MTPTPLKQMVRAARRFEFTWRYGFNFAPTLSYKFGHRSLSDEAKRVLTDLNRNGVAFTSDLTLLGPNSFYQELSAAVERLEHDLADQLAAKRAAANDCTAIGQKTFLCELLGRRPKLITNDIYARFALQSPILQIANAYFGMYTKLRDYNVWHTFPTQVQARESQLWHHDREDRYILKVFVNLSDIDEGAGPFTYAVGSHLKGTLRRRPASFLEADDVRRSTDEQMAEVVPPERWVKGIGPKGTIIFADTRGYHKGGLVRERDRILYFCMFTSQASQSKEILERPCRVSLPPDREQAFALSAPGIRPHLSRRLGR